MPDGASVTSSGIELCHPTPCEAVLDPSRDWVVTFEKGNHEPKTVRIGKSVKARWVVLDVLFGFVGVVVDAVTGGWYGLDTDFIQVRLKPSQTAVPNT